MADCDRLTECGFYQKYGKERDILCRGFLAMYCRGPKQGDCARKKFFVEHGHSPPDEMVPNGEMLRYVL